MDNPKLSDGQDAIVKKLRLYELDEVPVEILGPYTYEIDLPGGKKMLAEYDGSLWASPPDKPEGDPNQFEEGSEEWYSFREWVIYQAWLRHERRRMASIEAYHIEVVNYILTNCIDEETRRRIVTPGDWQVIYRAAICPEVTSEHLAVALRQTFQGLV